MHLRLPTARIHAYLRNLFLKFPRQFWLLMIGSLISSTGASMVWPFLSIYIRQTLNVPLAVVASLLTLNSIMGILTSLVSGAVADRFGRKGMMVTGLFAGSLYYVLMSRASTLSVFALLIGFWGAFSTLYPVGANAMIADLIPIQGRTEAYSLLRTVHNVGVGIGPILGGLLINLSYQNTFFAASAAFAFFGVLTLLRAQETLPASGHQQGQPNRLAGAGFTLVFRDRQFILFVLAFTITTMAAASMFIHLPVYLKENLGVPEHQYSYIVTINAAMVILCQYLVTQITRRYPALPVLAVGAFFYALGVGSVALGHSFWAVALSMAVMTVGELIMTPTATALTAALAPLEMRGRYMSLYGLVWPIGAGLGPILGGLLNDHISPAATWYSGGFFGLLSALAFLTLTYFYRLPDQARLNSARPDRLNG